MLGLRILHAADIRHDLNLVTIGRDRRISRSGLIGRTLRLKALLRFARASASAHRLDNNRARLPIDNDDGALAMPTYFARADDGRNTGARMAECAVGPPPAVQKPNLHIARQRRRIRRRPIAPDDNHGLISVASCALELTSKRGRDTPHRDRYTCGQQWIAEVGQSWRALRWPATPATRWPFDALLNRFKQIGSSRISRCASKMAARARQ
jgi:hypothetical protein